MNGYVIAGYVVTLGTLGIYALRILFRERALRRATSPDKSPSAP